MKTVFLLRAGASGAAFIAFWVVFRWHLGVADAQTSGSFSAKPVRVLAVALVPQTVYGHAPLVVAFTARVSGAASGENLSYRWDFGDGDGTVGPPEVVTHTYRQPGSYVATVTVTSDDGESASGSAGIIVVP